MLDKHFRMKIPNNLLVAPLACNLRMKSAFEELALALIHVFFKFHRAHKWILSSVGQPCPTAAHPSAAFAYSRLVWLWPEREAEQKSHPCTSFQCPYFLLSYKRFLFVREGELLEHCLFCSVAFKSHRSIKDPGKSNPSYVLNERNELHPSNSLWVGVP